MVFTVVLFAFFCLFLGRSFNVHVVGNVDKLMLGDHNKMVHNP